MEQEEGLNIHPLFSELLPLAEGFSSENAYLDSFLQNGDYALNANIGKNICIFSGVK